VNAVAERTKTAEMPITDAVACTSSPVRTPALVTDARRHPSVTARRAISAMSGPGEIVTRVAAIVNATICPSMPRCYERPNALGSVLP
jgi:hypothetical protein